MSMVMLALGQLWPRVILSTVVSTLAHCDNSFRETAFWIILRACLRWSLGLGVASLPISPGSVLLLQLQQATLLKEEELATNTSRF